MAFLDRLIHRAGQTTKECEHSDLVPEFERPEDTGDEAKASAYRCSGCGHVFEPGQAFLMRMRRSGVSGPSLFQN